MCYHQQHNMQLLPVAAGLVYVVKSLRDAATRKQKLDDMMNEVRHCDTAWQELPAEGLLLPALTGWPAPPCAVPGAVQHAGAAAAPAARRPGGADGGGPGRQGW